MRNLGRYVSAPPPVFGVPDARIPRFRAAMDAYGNQYDADFFTYTITMGLPGENIALAANGTIIENIDFDLDSVFELRSITGTAASGDSGNLLSPGIQLTFNDQVSSRALMSSPTFWGLLAGAAEAPNILPITRRFMPGTQLQVTFTDQAGVDYSELSLSFHGRKLFTQGAPPLNIPRFNQWRDRQNGLLLCEDLFYYVFDLASTVGTQAYGATFDLTLPRIEVESDFEWITSAAIVNLNAENEGQANDPSGYAGITVNLRDSSTGRYLMNAPLDLATYAGGNVGGYDAGLGLFPFILPQPRIWAAGTSPVLTVTNNNNETAELSEFQFVMCGRKIFEQS